MKKSIFILSLILVGTFFTQPCASQIDLVLGLTKSSITGGESWKDPIGVQLGAIVPVLNFSELLSLRVEANLSMQGARWEESLYKGRLNLLYINIPAVIRYQTENGFFGEAGIQPGILIAAKDKWEDYSENILDHMNKLDISIPIEVGYQINDKVSVGIRFIPGITDITEDEDEADRNLVFAFRGTWRLDLK